MIENNVKILTQKDLQECFEFCKNKNFDPKKYKLKYREEKIK